MKLADIQPNPENPRVIKDAKFKQLVNSLRDFPKMMKLRPIVIDKANIIQGGNMRFRALQELGYKEIPDEWVTRGEDLTPEEWKEFVVKDNISFGSWDFDILSSHYDADQLLEWGFDMPEFMEMPEQAEAEEDNYEIPEEIESTIQLGDIFDIGQHRLICGDATSETDAINLMGGRAIDLVITDPPYNVDYTGKTKDALKIQNDKKSDSAFFEFLFDFYKNFYGHTKPGGAWYIWHADSEGMNFRKAFTEAGFDLKQCLIWVKNSMVMGRQDYQWKHEPCQPAGTMVKTPNGWVAIEELKNGDRVVAFDTYSGSLKGLKEGIKINTASREYNGNMYEVSCGGFATRATDNHDFSIRFNPNPEKKYCVYLMQRGERFRVGRSVSYDARQFGLKTRMHQEKADKAWIIDTYETRIEAQMGEQYLAVQYGIPYTHWEPEKPYCKKNDNCRTVEHIDWLYNKLEPSEQKQRAKKLLTDFGRNYEMPLLDKDNIKNRFSRRVTVKINACNLIPGLMQLPIAYNGYIKDSTFEWKSIDSIKHSEFKGKVYSLEVPVYEHYVADGIITHNCLYGWKPGAAHYFIDDRTQTTVIDDKININKLSKEEMKAMLKEIFSEKVATSTIYHDRPSRSDVHPTMKPVTLMGYLMKNSSKRLELVADPFLGSGSTMVAAHQLHRRCFGMELDPIYCEVIIDRMIALDPTLEILKNGEPYTHTQLKK